MTKDEAVEYFGTQAALARALGIKRASVNGWHTIPIGRQYQIEVLTKAMLRADRGVSNAVECGQEQAA